MPKIKFKTAGEGCGRRAKSLGSSSMRKLNSPSMLFAAALLFTACYKAPTSSFDPKLPDFSKLDLSKIFDICDKKDGEMPDVSPEAEAAKLTVTDDIDVQDITYKKDQKDEFTVHEPVRVFKGDLQLAPSAPLSEPVSYVTIENFRTCVKQDADASGDKLSSRTEEVTLDDGRKITVPSQKPVVGTTAK